MKNISIVVGILVVIGVGYYFISKPASTIPSVTAPATTNIQPENNMAMPSAAPQTAPAISTSTSSNTTTAQSATVSIKNFAFSPATLSVKAGTKVTWTNDDSTAHTVTSDSGTQLNSAPIAPGSSFSFTFTAPGTYTYHCSIHPMMHGTIVVTS